MQATLSYVFYGLASQITGKVFDWYPTSEDAERARAEIDHDDPELAALIYVIEVDLSGKSLAQGPYG